MKQIIYALLPFYAVTIQAAELSYNNKPVNPECFTNIIKTADDPNSVKSISLSTCSTSKTGVMIIDDFYRNKHRKENEFTQYSIIGQSGNKYLLALGMSTIGSGFFTSVIWAEKSGDQLYILKVLNNGDRCNGGADKVSEWKYAINLTPVDLLNQVAGAHVQLDAYRDLDSSATSCVASAIYRFDPKSQQPKFIAVKFKKSPLAMESWVYDLNFQYCFNRLYNSYLERGQIKLAQVDLDRFRNQFEAICMRYQH
jgi:hypothetical protein